MLSEPGSRTAEDAEPVGIVHHQPGIVALFQGDEAGEVRRIPVHAVEAFDHDQCAAMLVARGAEQGLQGVEIVMGEGATLGSRKLGPGDDAVMAQRIVEDHVAGFQQGADRGDVGGVAAHHHDAGFGLVMVGQRLFEADMAWALAGDDPARGGRGAELVDGPARRLADVGMSVEPEIIVGREIDEALAGDARRGARPGLVDPEERIAEADQVGGRAL